jgi:predicted PurR-regulated permease PerM
MRKRYSNLIFGASFAVALLLFGRIMAPFLMPVILGGLLVVLSQPIQRAMTRVAGRRRALAAGLSTAAVVLLILVPLVSITFFVARELLVALDTARELFDDPKFRAQTVEKLPHFLQRFVFRADGESPLEKAVTTTLSGSAGNITDLLGAGTEFALDVFLMTVSMYYFFLDGRRIYAQVVGIIPMDRRYLDAFANEFKDVAYAIVYGNTITALVQGATGLVGLLIAGVPHAIVWAMAMVVAALIPIGGTALVWGPVSFALFMTGHYTESLFSFVWGALMVSTVDNLVRPRLCGSRMTLHPLLVFLSMFGGLAVFGAMGLLVGPLIAAIFMSMVRIYRRDFLQAEEAAPEQHAPVAAVQPVQAVPGEARPT